MKYSRPALLLCLSAICLLVLARFPTAKTHAGFAHAPLPIENRAAGVANRLSQDVKSPATLPSKVSDFDGNSFADYAVCAPGVWNIWYVNYAPTTACSALTCKLYLGGTGTDILVPGDYTLDLSTNFVLFDTTGKFKVGIDSPAIIINFNPQFAWGLNGDTPLAADFIGTSAIDFVVVRSIAGQLYWFVQENPSGPAMVFAFGSNGDVLVPGDYDGDGKTDLTVWRPSTGTWYSRGSAFPNTLKAVVFGTVGDIPLLGNFDANQGTGNTMDDFAVYRAGTWYILNSSGLPAPVSAYTWGTATDIPVPADYDNDNDADIVVYRQITQQWWSYPSINPVVFGLTTNDIPLPAAYVKCPTPDRLCF